jgi:phosphoglucomutase
LSLTPEEYQGKALVVAGDGRFYNDVAIQTIIKMAAANGVNKVYVGLNGLISTPAASAIIRKLNKDNGENYCVGGILLTASHNPGGEHEDFGIKFNSKNGGPALESLTNKIYEHSKIISTYKILDTTSTVSLSTLGDHQIGEVEDFDHQVVVNVMDSTEAYVELMKSLFDFDKLK